MKEEGFTIIELIVVIAIIGILAAIVMINVTKYIQSARNTAIFENLRNLSTCYAAYAGGQDPGVSSVCFSDCSDSVGKAITGPNPRLYYGCYDETGGSEINDRGDQVISHDSGWAMSTCADGKWVVYSQGLDNSNIMYCLDSTGHTTLNENGVNDTCSCN